MGKCLEIEKFSSRNIKNRENIFTFSYTRVYNNNKNNITYNTKFATNNHKTQEYMIYITVNKVI